MKYCGHPRSPVICWLSVNAIHTDERSDKSSMSSEQPVSRGNLCIATVCQFVLVDVMERAAGKESANV